MVINKLSASSIIFVVESVVFSFATELKSEYLKLLSYVVFKFNLISSFYYAFELKSMHEDSYKNFREKKLEKKNILEKHIVFCITFILVNIF